MTMSIQPIPNQELDAIQAEQVKAYFQDANDLNLAGALVFSLLVYVVHEEAPAWNWAPALLLLYLITLFRTALILQYHRTPERRSARQWINGQTLGGGLAGLCWGLSCTAMQVNLPITLQLFVLTVSTAVAATSATEGFFLIQPSRLFILATLIPQTLWLLIAGDRIHIVLAVMLMVFIPVVLMQGRKKNIIFVEAQHLRFQKELLANELARQHQLVEQASQSKSRFLAVASHDLRQPLAALMLFMELLEAEPLSPHGKELLERAQQATASLRSLLDALLDISKLDARTVEPVVRPFVMQRLFDELEQEFIALAERKGIRLDFMPCSQAIESDQILLGQILRNLISNALRYTPSGRIVIGCRRQQGMLDIEVHDTGIGITEGQATKIFDEFYQVGNQERDQQHGLGLGLSIVDRAARLLGHDIGLRSRPGKGSCFTITVPPARTAVADDRPVPERLREDVLAGCSIGVIENEAGIRSGLQKLMQTWGCRVATAGSVKALIRLFEASGDTVDMIVSDFSMGGAGNGIDAIAALRQRYGSTLPALLFTGDISAETAEAAHNAGLPILYKPASPEALHAAIAQAMSHPPPVAE
jgi:signal transduction histidine kinase